MKYRSKKGERNRAISEYTGNLGSAIARHRARIAERAARVEAERASKMKSAFIANMSHELRTPLNAVLGFSDILQKAEAEPLEPAQVAEFATYINDAAEHLLAVVNSILSISKIESGTTVLDLEDISLQEIVGNAMRFVQMKADKKNVAMHEQYDEDLPRIKGDPVRLRQVYINLINNAVKFTPEGGAVSVGVRKLAEHQLLVTVGDTGIGMDEVEIQIALSPFGQVDNELSRKQEGTGLGLAIAKGLVEQHGGMLEISSEKGQGTIVATMLPVTADEQSKPEGDREAA